MRAKQIFITFLTASLLVSACRKSEEFNTDKARDYMIALEPGKYITYRLDSTVFLDHGTIEEIHAYHEKHMVDAQIPDAEGRPSWRIMRYLQDTLGLQPWVPAGTYLITPLPHSVEVIENNLRVIRLTEAIQEGNSWRPNRYLADNPLRAQYEFQNDVDMENWDHYYATVGETINLNGQTIENVITVNGIDRIDNFPIVTTTVYASIDYQKEQYAKGIGMIYQEWTMWDYQGPHDNVPVGQKHGFSIRRSMIDHN